MFIEFIGTFFLVLVVGLSGNPIAVGAVLMCMVYMGGHLSGAHYNPAVTLGIFFDKKISFLQMLGYWLAQILGAIAAAAEVWMITGKYIQLQPKTTLLNAWGLETLFTFALVLVVLNVADHPKTKSNSFYGIAVGFTVLAAAFAAGPLSGGAFNPAVGIGPALFHTFHAAKVSALENVWIYLLGPFTGGALASLLFVWLKEEEM